MGPLDLEVGLGQFWGGGPHWGFSIPCSPFLPPPSSIHNLLCNKVLVPLLQYFSTLQCLHAIAFLLSESSPFKHKSSRQRERERAVDRRPFALAFASPINLKRLRTGWQLRHSVRQQMLVPKTPKENSSLFTSSCKPQSLAMTNFVPTKMLTTTGMMVMSTVGVGSHNGHSEFVRKKLSECLTLVTGRLSNNPLARSPG